MKGRGGLPRVFKMKKFVIVTDSCSDLSLDLREKYSVDYIPMHFSFNDADYVADLDWGTFSPREFYDVMRNGTRIFTSQVNAQEYVEAFEAYINEGYDILSISCSAALSASVKASYAARDTVMEKYPDAKIICIDSLISCGGLALLCMKAAMLRDEDKTIEEVAAWVEENKLNFHQEATVDKLIYLKQSGRISAASAFFGGLLNIKPIIISDVKGRNVSVEKVKGRSVSIKRLAERFAESYVECDLPIIISHADSLEDAEAARAELLKLYPNADIIIGYVGPIVGASVGPGTLCIYYYGTKETFDADTEA